MDDVTTVGDVMSEGRRKVIKGFVLLLSVFVYLAGIFYAEAHGFNLLFQGISEDLFMWAMAGMVALGATAIGLPLGLHFWFFSAGQKYFAYAFYGVDLMLLFFNAVADNAWNKGLSAEMPWWIQMYMVYIVPATPVIVALGWSMIWMLDPSAKEMEVTETLKASTREALAKRVAKAANSTEVSDMVNDAAQALAENVISKTLGISPRKRTIPGLPGEIRSAEPSKNGHSMNGNGHGVKKFGKRVWDSIRPDGGEDIVYNKDEEMLVTIDTERGQAEVTFPNRNGRTE